MVGPRPATVGPVSTFFTLNTELGHDLILLKHENYTHCSTAPLLQSRRDCRQLEQDSKILHLSTGLTRSQCTDIETRLSFPSIFSYFSKEKSGESHIVAKPGGETTLEESCDGDGEKKERYRGEGTSWAVEEGRGWEDRGEVRRREWTGGEKRG